MVDQTPDELGDTSVIAADTRSTSFKMKAKVYNTLRNQAEAGYPGRDEAKRSLLHILKRDRPPTALWVPQTNDLVELASGEKLFVMSAEPAFPRNRSVGSPDGGFDGWSVTLTDRSPALSGATRYD
jgi:hypothetical protein